MAKRGGSELVICLGVGLTLAVLVIVYLLWSRNTSHKKESMHIAPQPSPQPSPQPTLPQEPANPPALVMFYGDFCGHSKAALPMWGQVKQALASSPIRTIEFQHETQQEEIQKHGVNGYPTFRLYPSGFPGEYIEYSGDRSPESMMKFVQSRGQAS